MPPDDGGESAYLREGVDCVELPALPLLGDLTVVAIPLFPCKTSGGMIMHRPKPLLAVACVFSEIP